MRALREGVGEAEGGRGEGPLTETRKRQRDCVDTGGALMLSNSAD